MNMIDSSPYTIAFRIQAAAWFYESDRSAKAMRDVKAKLKATYDSEPPHGRIIAQWMEKLFATGSLFDKPRSGRPSNGEDVVRNVENSVAALPRLSTRKRAQELDLPRSTVQRILKEDLHMRPWKPCQVQFLTHEDHENRVQCCQAILRKYGNARRCESLFFLMSVHSMEMADKSTRCSGARKIRIS